MTTGLVTVVVPLDDCTSCCTVYCSYGTAHDASDRLATASRISFKEFNRCPFSDGILLISILMLEFILSKGNRYQAEGSIHQAC